MEISNLSNLLIVSLRQKQIGNIKMFGNLWLITIFDNFLLPNKLDLSANSSYHSRISEKEVHLFKGVGV